MKNNKTFFFKNMLFIFLFCSAAISAVIIFPLKNEHNHFNQTNTLIMFDVDGVLIDRPIAQLQKATNIWKVIKDIATLFWESTNKFDLLKTVFAMFKDRVRIQAYINKYDLNRIITWLAQQYPVLQQPTKSGIPFSVLLKELLIKATPNNDTIQLLKTLHDKGYKIAIATNQGKGSFQHFIASGMIPDLSYYIVPYTIDYGCSKEDCPKEGFVKKPKKQYYKNFKAALEQTDFHPEHLVFIDDNLQNLTKAAKKGIIGIHFISAQQTEDDLKKLGIVI